MTDRSHLLTELRLPESMNLDAMSTEEAVEVMNAQDAKAVAAVGAEKTNIAAAIELVVAALHAGGSPDVCRRRHERPPGRARRRGMPAHLPHRIPTWFRDSWRVGVGHVQGERGRRRLR
jgi:hypothetical protein